MIKICGAEFLISASEISQINDFAKSEVAFLGRSNVGKSSFINAIVNQKNLAKELEKIVRISAKALSSAPHRKIIILDATQGNNSVIQAKAFNEITKIDGIIITKLDGTPKGGALFGIARELEIPILYIGVGEKMEDLIEFNAQNFVETLVDGIYE